MTDKEKPHGYAEQTGNDASVRRDQGHDLAHAAERGAFYSTTFVRAFKTADGEWRNAASFSVADLDALVTLAAQAKQWIATVGPR